MKILVCDDSNINRQVIGAHIQQMGYKAIFAENIVQSAELFAEHHPELVLIDVDMTQMDGYEIARAIRQSAFHFSKWIPIVFMSVHIDDESIVKGVEAGGDDFLSKPINLAALRAKIYAMRRLVMMRENLLDFGNQLRAVNEKLLQANQLLSELSVKDPLTRLANRRAFEEALIKTSKIAMRTSKPLSLLMIDIDDFKIFNESYGFEAGDFCLQQVAQIFKQGIHRAADFGARFGGEIFAIILADTSLSGAMYVAERLRMGVEALQIPNEKTPPGILTVSIGVASSKADKEFVTDSLVAASDEALYRAKQSGSNCIVGAKIEVDTNVPEDWLNYKTYRHFSPSGGSTSKH